MNQHLSIGPHTINLTQQGQGPALIWCHGLLQSMQTEDELGITPFESLSRSFQVTRFDAVGHGKSSPSSFVEDYTWPNIAQTIIDIADSLSIEKMILGGNSMGAASAIWAYHLFPKRIDALVLQAPPSAFANRKPLQAFFQKQAQIIRKKGIEKWLDSKPISKTPSILEPVSRIFEAINHQQLEKDPQVLAAMFEGAACSDLPPMRALETIKVPCYLMAWDQYPGHHITTCSQLCTLIPETLMHIAQNYQQAQSDALRMIEFLHHQKHIKL